MEDVFYALPVIPRPRARPTTGSDRGSLRSRDLTLFVGHYHATTGQRSAQENGVNGKVSP
jgi:hypothetical protein